MPDSFVNEFLLPNFGPGSIRSRCFPGIPEMELALIELYRLTGDKRHLELAGYLLAGTHGFIQAGNYVYHFCGIPFTSRTPSGRARGARDVRVLWSD